MNELKLFFVKLMLIFENLFVLFFVLFLLFFYFLFFGELLKMFSCRKISSGHPKFTWFLDFIDYIIWIDNNRKNKLKKSHGIFILTFGFYFPTKILIWRLSFKNLEKFSVENILKLQNIVILENVNTTYEEIAQLNFKETTTKYENRNSVSLQWNNLKISQRLLYNMFQYASKTL